MNTLSPDAQSECLKDESVGRGYNQHYARELNLNHLFAGVTQAMPNT